MTCRLATVPGSRLPVVDALVIGVRDGHPNDARGLRDSLDLLGFGRSPGVDPVVITPTGGPAPVVVAVRLPDDPDEHELRRSVARAWRVLPPASRVAVDLRPATAAGVAAIAEGILLADHRFTTYVRTPRQEREVHVVATAVATAEAGQALHRARVVASAVNQTRDWVNTGPSDQRPAEFAAQLVRAAPPGVDVEVWDADRLAVERCAGHLAVGSGSSAPPHLVRMSYSPESAREHIVLVGKGVTFDAGGLSLKPAAAMEEMKFDMAGAAAVVAALCAIAELGLDVGVTAYACLAENLPGPAAFKPGDVLRMRDDSTVEVHNTDSEGRLLLADGLLLAGEQDADAVLTVATLTYAAMIALGMRTTAVLGNDDALVGRVLAAAARSDEPAWRMPIPAEIAAQVASSRVAELRQHNADAPHAGACFAAGFLREFVRPGTPWAHLDIAGPAYNHGEAYDYTPSGGTGAIVRSLIELAAGVVTDRETVA